MEENDNYIYYPPKPELIAGNQNNLTRSLISLGLFMLVFYLIFNDTRVLFLVVLILFLHEMGHFIAMKAFGYNDVSMFFIPLMGAMVVGEKEKVSQFQKAIIVLAGPIPGILIGFGIMEYALSIEHTYVLTAGIMFMFVNVLNLLPLDPLDGGKLIETLFFAANEKVKQIFLIGSFVLMIAISIAYMEPILALLGVFMFSRIKMLQNLTQIRNKIRDRNINLNKTYDDVSDQDYWLIRKEYLLSSKLSKMIDPEVYENSPYEDKIAQSVKNILIKPIIKDISIIGKLLFVIIWLAGLVAPFLYAFPLIEKMLG